MCNEQLKIRLQNYFGLNIFENFLDTFLSDK